MTIRQVFEKTLRRELSVGEAAEITGVAERDILARARARRAGHGGLDEHGRKRLKEAASTQTQYAVALYRERYTELPASDFVRVLKLEHGIVIKGPRLYFALRKEGLVAPRPLKAWRLAAAGLPPRPVALPPPSPSEVTTPTPDRSPIDPLLRVGQELQALTDRVDRLNAQARDRIVDWRRGIGTLESAVSAVAALKEFIVGLPPK